ncbi:hypothetical protein A3Q56_00681 [Intoshia linei]|uniref:Uncharacterized protein n=1 Tax=Intoshia linei TaxID=1819745 RepID=A0A177BB76_9BILA|nr:hypothetical protein A3Q56_00681 [Intoshia linei]
MGVAGFFRFISERYPLCMELISKDDNIHLDNLYIDFNGIIHNCTHKNTHTEIKNNDIYFKAISDYILLIIETCLPKNIVYIAIDGVAPRSKINNQRTRRYRSVLDKLKVEESDVECFSSNCISPGTQFMEELHCFLLKFIAQLMSNNKRWSHLKFYYSGHDVPSEGEHKIMKFIRWYTKQSDYNINTSHAIYGNDADLLSLGICTNQPKVYLLREKIYFTANSMDQEVADDVTLTKFYYLHIQILKDYLILEFQNFKNVLQQTKSFEFDESNLYYDWILLNFVIGNDFLHQIPCFKITSNNLVDMWKVYSDVVPLMDGYLSDGKCVNFKRFLKFLSYLTFIELEEMSWEDEIGLKLICNDVHESTDSKLDYIPTASEFFENKNLNLKQIDTCEDGLPNLERNPNHSLDEIDGEAYKQRKISYYRDKIGILEGITMEEQVQEMIRQYLIGIQWVYQYYTLGLSSWTWFYPYYYAPFVTDIIKYDLTKLDTHVNMDKPLNPFYNLMLILPPQDSSLLPEAFRPLMTDKNSPLIKYFPKTVEVDENGETVEWKFILKIPFVDTVKMVELADQLLENLTDEEKNRMVPGFEWLFVYSDQCYDVNLESFKTRIVSEGDTDANSDSDLENTINLHANIYKLRNDWMPTQDNLLPETIPLKSPCFNLFDTFNLVRYSTLSNLDFRVKFMKGVFLHSIVSRRESLFIKLNKIYEKTNHYVENIKGKCVIGLPYCKLAVPDKIIDDSGVYEFIYEKNDVENIKIFFNKHSSISNTTWLHNKKKLFQKLSNIGIKIEQDLDILVECFFVIGYKYVLNNDGTVRKRYTFDARRKAFYPINLIQTVDTSHVNNDFFNHRKIDINKNLQIQETSKDCALSDVLKLNSKAIVISKEFYGQMGTIFKMEKGNQYQITLKFNVRPEPLVLSLLPNLQYIPHVEIFKVAKNVGMNITTIKSLASVINIKGCKTRLNCFNWYNIYQGTCAVDYVKIVKHGDGHSLYFSEAAICKIKLFQKRFPKLITILNKKNYKIADIFKDDSIKSQFNDFFHKQSKDTPSAVSFTTDNLTTEQIDNLLRIVAKNNASIIPQHENIIHDQFCILDRVICIWVDFRVPLGLSGTVVGIYADDKDINRSRLLVCWDSDISDGLVMGSKKRKCGCNVPLASVISIKPTKDRKGTSSGISDIIEVYDLSNIDNSKVNSTVPIENPKKPNKNKEVKTVHQSDKVDNVTKIKNVINDDEKCNNENQKSKKKKKVGKTGSKIRNKFEYLSD